MDYGVLGGLLVGAGLAVVAILMLIWYILRIVGYWKVFTKAGEAGWKSIIPIYNVFVQYKFTWNTKFFWLLIVLEVIGNLIGGNGEGILYVISIILLLAGAIIYIMQLNNLSKAFGHGVGFTIGLIFLEPIFTMILGFGSSEYKGNPTTTN